MIAGQTQPSYLVPRAVAPLTAGLLIMGFLLALGLRVAVGGVGVARSPVAGLVFAVALLLLSFTVKHTTGLALKVFGYGLVGAAVLCLPVLLKTAGLSATHPVGNYTSWAVVVACVALAEEVFLRGALFAVVQRWHGRKAAVIIAAILFALLHVPLYGWHVVPLDLAVGLWLGVLRVVAGSWVAPGIAHTLADFAGWWFV